MTPDDLNHDSIHHGHPGLDHPGLDHAGLDHPGLDHETVVQARILLDAITLARSEHITYEQMDAWVEDEMDQTGRELVMAHVGLCTFCAKQLTAYEAHAAAMGAPVASPAQLVPFWDRLRTSLKWPQFAMIALAITVAILAPKVIRNSRSAGTGVESLASLPPSLREAARSIVDANEPLRPTALADLGSAAEPLVDSPVAEVIEETQPELRWKAFASAYAVSILDQSGHEVGQAAAVTAAQWTVPVSLNRGAKYTWEVRASNSGEGGQVHRATFRVLGDSEEQSLTQLRASGAGPLALGAIAQQFGLLSMAQREFEQLAKDSPQSPDAAKLLGHVTSLRTR
jgi:hypothetical protein